MINDDFCDWDIKQKYYSNEKTKGGNSETRVYDTHAHTEFVCRHSVDQEHTMREVNKKPKKVTTNKKVNDEEKKRRQQVLK